MKKILLWGWIGWAMVMAHAVAVTGVVNTRTNANARVVTGQVSLGSPDGGSAMAWDSTAVADGWQTVTVGGCSTNLLVLNSCAVYGGRLSADTSWVSNRVVVLNHSVIIPKDVTLTVAAGTVVKFAPGTALEVAVGGSLVLQGAYLADFADDSVGGDTNYDGDSSLPVATADDWVSGVDAPRIIRVVLWDGGTQVGATRWYTVDEAFGVLPVLSRSGFRFEGWWTEAEGGEQVTEKTVVSVSQLYAHWTADVLNVDSTKVVVPAIGGSFSFGVTANIAWSVAVENAAWITLANKSGSGDGTVSFTVAEQSVTQERSAVIKVSSGDITCEVLVCQDGCDGVATPKISPADGTEFSGSKWCCSLSCATEGATIYYTLNGKEPDQNDTAYAGVSFNIFDSTTIKARAYKSGMVASAVATARIVKKQTLAEALDVPLWSITNDAATPWVVDTENSYGSKASVRSGKLAWEEGYEAETAIETEIVGAGTLSFWWKVSCEKCTDEGYYWDYLALVVDDVEVLCIDGDSGWKQVSVSLGAGSHRIAWLYHKDDMDDEGATGMDCAWVDSVSWSPEVVSGIKGISEAWLQNVGVATGISGANVEAIASSDSDGDGLTVAEEFIVGTDPTDADSKFTAKIEMVDGKPVVSWEPDLQDNELPRVYWLQGSNDLNNWDDIEDSETGDYKFFRVKVDMQE